MASEIEKIILDLTPEEVDAEDLLDWTLMTNHPCISFDFIRQTFDRFPWDADYLVRWADSGLVDLINLHVERFRSLGPYLNWLLMYIPIQDIGRLSPELGLTWPTILGSNTLMSYLCMNRSITPEFIQMHSAAITANQTWSAIGKSYRKPAELIPMIPLGINLSIVVKNPNLTDAIVKDLMRLFDLTEIGINAVSLSPEFIREHRLDYVNLDQNPNVTIRLLLDIDTDLANFDWKYLSCPGIRQLEIALYPEISVVSRPENTSGESSTKLSDNPNVTPEFMMINRDFDWAYHGEYINNAPIDMYEIYPRLFDVTLVGYHPDLTLGLFREHRDICLTPDMYMN